MRNVHGSEKKVLECMLKTDRKFHTRKSIAEETGLATQTVKHALWRLHKVGKIKKKRNPDNNRREYVFWYDTEQG